MLADVVLAHQERAVVRLGDVFIKADTSGDRVARELAALASVDVPRPQLLWYRPGPVSLVALSEIAGSPLGALGSPSSHGAEAWATAGRLARHVHEHAVPERLNAPSRYRLDDVDALADWLVARGVTDRGIVGIHADRARAARHAAENDCLVHGDLQAGHIFMTTGDEIAGVIDWGDAGIGDRHYDLAVLTVGHGEHLDAVLEGYGRAVDRDRIAGYWSWRRLGSVRWMLEHGYDAGGDIDALAFGI